MNQYAILGLFVVGVLLRVIVPYLITYLEKPQPFRWRYVTSQALGALAGVLSVLVQPEYLDKFAEHEPITIIASGFMFAAGGRLAQKAFNGGRRVFANK